MRKLRKTEIDRAWAAIDGEPTALLINETSMNDETIDSEWVQMLEDEDELWFEWFQMDNEDVADAVLTIGEYAVHVVISYVGKEKQ